MSEKDDKLVEEVQNWMLANRYKHLEDVIRYAIEAGRQELIKEIEEKMVEACPPTSTCGELFGIWEEDWKALKGGKHV